jgi:hypothetical protein
VGREASAEVDAPMIEILEHEGVRLATIIRSNASVEGTRFATPVASSMQIGVMMRNAGEVIEAHEHRVAQRIISDVQEAIIVQSGRVEVDFYREGRIVRTVAVSAGDAALLADVPLAVRIIEDARCILVKQGPYLGPDKVHLK